MSTLLFVLLYNRINKKGSDIFMINESTLVNIGHFIGNNSGREFDYMEIEDNLYVFFYYTDYVSEYVEIPKSDIFDYVDNDLEFHYVAV